MRQPKFDNLLRVLSRRAPDRPTLFEFFLNAPLYRRLAGREVVEQTDALAGYRLAIQAYLRAGYDYATVMASEFRFPGGEIEQAKTRSLNQGFVITDRESFEAYEWPDPDDFDYSKLERITQEIPEGMKLIVWGPGGVLENVIALAGYENLCFMIYEDPGLVQELFDAVGSRLVRYYERSAPFGTVGALISNDDWGFKTQTMLSTNDMRKYVFPWHKKIVEVIHSHGKPAILHSCGNMEKVMEDIIEDMGYDGKHSFEDSIQPVEDAYEQYVGRIAILGGIDVDFVCSRSPKEVRERSARMLERTRVRGGYALGTGNSVPEYVPQHKYLAMISAAVGDIEGELPPEGEV